jgi:hypothetical protein
MVILCSGDTVPGTPHPSDLEARPRKPDYSLLKQPEPALTTSPDDHEHNKLEDVSAAPKQAGRVANWKILGTFSCMKAENYLEERDSVQHAGLLGEVKTTAKPLDVQGARVTHPASHISSS